MISALASSVRDRLQGGEVQGGLSPGAVEAAKAQVAALKAAEVEAVEGRARGDVAYATGVSTVAGPVTLISAVSSPDQGVWASLKWVASTAVSIGAAIACQPLTAPVAGVCAGVAGRFTDGLLSGKSPGELFKYTFNPLSMGRDAALGAMTMGFGRVAAGLVPKAGSALPVVLGSAAASVVAGGLTDMAVVLASGGSWEDAIAKAMNPTARGIDFAMGFAEGLKVWKGRPTAKTTAATNTAYRGPSQFAPGGQAGPAVSLDQVKQCLGRCGMSVSKYDISHTPVIDSPVGPAFGRTSIVNGKPVIEISDMGLSSMDEAVTTIFHETYHADAFRAFGTTGTEEAAEGFGQRMLQQFQRRNR